MEACTTIELPKKLTGRLHDADCSDRFHFVSWWWWRTWLWSNTCSKPSMAWRVHQPEPCLPPCRSPCGWTGWWEQTTQWWFLQPPPALPSSLSATSPLEQTLARPQLESPPRRTQTAHLPMPPYRNLRINHKNCNPTESATSALARAFHPPRVGTGLRLS